MSEAQIKLWYRRFKDGRESVEGDRRSGRPSTSRTPENVESVRAAINENRRLTVRELEEDLGIPRTTVSQILTEDLGKKRVAAKFGSQLEETFLHIREQSLSRGASQSLVGGR